MARSITSLISALLLYPAITLAADSHQGGQKTYGQCSQATGVTTGGVYVNVCFSGGNKAQDAYLIATHPTHLGVDGASFLGWVEDNGEVYLNALFSNTSEIPALDVSFDVLERSTNTALNRLKAVKIRRSAVLSQTGEPRLTIGANTKQSLPIASLDDLVRSVAHENPKDICIYDASVTPWDSSEELRAKATLPIDVRAGLEPAQGVEFVLRLRYRTIFDERATVYQPIFLYYRPRLGNGLAWYPSKKKYDQFRCGETASWSVTVLPSGEL